MPMLKTSTTQTQLTKNMTTRIIKDNGDCKREMVLIHENSNTGTKIYSEKDGIGVLAAFFDHDSLDSSAQWFESREALEEAYPGTLPQDYSEYSVKISSDPSYYGNDCTQQDADRIAASLADLIRSEFPGIDIVENDLNSKTTGPDETVIEEINTWIEKNWTAAL